MTVELRFGGKTLSRKCNLPLRQNSCMSHSTWGGGDLVPLNILFLNDCLDIKSPLDLNLNMPLPTFALFVPRVKCVTVISQTISIIFIEVVIFVQDFQLSHDEGISMSYLV